MSTANPLNEDNANLAFGMYRAKIVKLDEDTMNGIYFVRVYPFQEELKDDELKQAVSNLTNKYFHIQLHVDDWVWVFFENGLMTRPVIFDVCNFKDSYPKATIGEYGVVSTFKFGEKIIIEIDEDKMVANIKINEKTEINIDEDGIKITDEFENEIITSTDGIDVKDKNKNEISLTSSGVKIDAGTNDIKIVGGNLTVGNLSVPMPSGLCGIPNCLYAGSPHTTNSMKAT